MAVAVWLGDPANVKTLPARVGAGDVFRTFMSAVLDGQPTEQFPQAADPTYKNFSDPTYHVGGFASSSNTDERRMTRRRRTPRTRTPTRARTILRRRRRDATPTPTPTPDPTPTPTPDPTPKPDPDPTPTPTPTPDPGARRTSRQARLRTRKPFRYERVASPARRRANRYDSSTMIRCKRAGTT